MYKLVHEQTFSEKRINRVGKIKPCFTNKLSYSEKRKCSPCFQVSQGYCVKTDAGAGH